MQVTPENILSKLLLHDKAETSQVCLVAGQEIMRLRGALAESHRVRDVIPRSVGFDEFVAGIREEIPDATNTEIYHEWMRYLKYEPDIGRVAIHSARGMIRAWRQDADAAFAAKQEKPLA